MRAATGKKWGIYAAVLVFGAALAPAKSARAVACQPASASITYAADDYFYFYLNGNSIVTPVFDNGGQPSVTVPIPVGDFAPAGGADYFAFENANSVPAQIDCTWLITITCVGGSTTYLTPADTALTMYNDQAGNNTPPPYNGIPWYDSTWQDVNNLFNGAPVDVTNPNPAIWYPPLTNPSTGATVPIISWDNTGQQTSNAETLYYREALVLPTPPPTPTPYPTVCGATPASVELGSALNPPTQAVVFNDGGCVGSGNPTSWTVNIPGGPGEVLLVQLSSPANFAGVNLNGTALAPIQTDAAVPTGEGDLYTYYMLNPPAGNNTLSLAGAPSGCGINVVASVYENINTTSYAAAFGAIQASKGNAGVFKDTITTQSPYSIIADLFDYPNGNINFTNMTGNPLFVDTDSAGGNDNVFGSYYNAAAPTQYSMNYTYNTGGGTDNWWGVAIELKAVTACGSTPTNTNTFTPTKTNTPTNTNTNTSTFTPTYTNTFTPTKTNTPTSTNTNTSTFTPTYTNTFTPTKTNTPTSTNTFTLTDTPTSTNTSTPTNTSTNTPTKTNTPTDTTTPIPPTNTPTSTNTYTMTDTNTNTNTPTSTHTFTPTNTNTNTPTKTNTPTDTTTPVPPTNTFTNTNSYTPTDTSTDTNTPTNTGTFTPTNTGTYTPTDTNTATNTNTYTPTDTSTNTNTPTNTGTFTPTNTDTYTPTDTNTATNTNTNTNTPTKTNTPVPPTPTFTDTPTWTNSATATVSQSSTVTSTFTLTSTPVSADYTVKVDIYNSAGELVRSLYNGTSEFPAGQAQVLQTAVQGGGVQVDVSGLGGNAGANLVWAGTNDDGQAVASGSYYVQISTVNTFGQAQTQDKTVSVVSAGGPVTLGVYNSAGELVCNLTSDLAGLVSEPTGMSLPVGQNAVVASTGPGKGGLNINLTLANGNATTVFWNGLSSQGQPLQSGNYLLTLSQTQTGSNEVMKTETIVVLAVKDESANGMANSAMVVPNPVAEGRFEVRYQTGSLGIGTFTAVGRLYDLDGHRVAEATDHGSGTLRYSGDWGPGIYLLDFEVHNGDSGVLARRILKVAVVR